MKYIEFTRKFSDTISINNLYPITEECIYGNGTFYYFKDNEDCRSCVSLEDETVPNYFRIVEGGEQ